MNQKRSSLRLKIFAIVIVVLLIALFSINFFAAQYAKKNLEAAFNSNSQGYKFHFESLHVNVFTGSAKAGNIRLNPGPANSNDSIQQMDFAATSLKLSGINWYSLLFKKNICIGEIYLQNPVIAIKNFRSVRKKSSPKKHFSIYNLIHPKFESLRINKLEVQDGTISVTGRDSSNFFLASKEVSFEVIDLVADSFSEGAGKIFDISNAAASLKNIRGNFSKGLYRIAIPSFTFSTKDSVLDIDSLFFSPTVNKMQFAKKLGYQKAYREIMLAGVHAHSGKFISLIEQKELLIDRIEIGFARIYNYKDKNLPAKFTRYVLHHTFLASLQFKIELKKIKVDDGLVSYDLLAPGATDLGHIYFDSLRFALSNFSSIALNDTMKVDISGSAMSQAAFEIHILLPLSKDEFYASGTLGSHEMPIWNSILANYKTPIQITTGHAESGTFSFTANATKGIGSMTFIYSDLKIKTLNEQHTTGGVKNAVKTFVANRIIIEKDNPDRDVLRIGKIDFARSPGRNFISYVYHMIFNGMESSVGMREEKMKKDISRSD